MEDNPVDRKLLGKLFKKQGCRIQYAHDGVEAIEICKRQAFSLIVMNVNMPRLNGVDAAREIRQLINPNKNQPIIGITSDETDQERFHCLDAGMNDYYQKPIHISNINYIMEDWLVREPATFAVS